MTGNSLTKPSSNGFELDEVLRRQCRRCDLQPTEAPFTRPLENSWTSKLPICLSQTMFQLPLRPRLDDFDDNNLAAFSHSRPALGYRGSHHRACHGNSRSPRSRCFEDL